MKKILAYLKDKIRDQVAESFELRRLAIKCREAAWDRDDAANAGNKELADKLETERRKLYQKWEILAESYEKKWLK